MSQVPYSQAHLKPLDKPRIVHPLSEEEKGNGAGFCLSYSRYDKTVRTVEDLAVISTLFNYFSVLMPEAA